MMKQELTDDFLSWGLHTLAIAYWMASDDDMPEMDALKAEVVATVTGEPVTDGRPNIIDSQTHVMAPIAFLKVLQRAAVIVKEGSLDDTG